MLRLYDREASGNAYKIRLFLSLLGLPCECVPVPMKDGWNQVDSSHLELNPRGQIPTLRDGEVSLWGSTAILCYLAAARQLAQRALHVLETRLGLAAWLVGAGPTTIADVSCFPYAALAGEGNIDTSPYAGVQRWIANVKSLDRFVGMPGI